MEGIKINFELSIGIFLKNELFIQARIRIKFKLKTFRFFRSDFIYSEINNCFRFKSRIEFDRFFCGSGIEFFWGFGL